MLAAFVHHFPGGVDYKILETELLGMINVPLVPKSKALFDIFSFRLKATRDRELVKNKQAEGAI